MSREATQADLNAAHDITMEGSGDSLSGEGEERSSLFGETVPEIDESDNASGDVNPAPSQPSDDIKDLENADTDGEGEGQEDTDAAGAQDDPEKKKETGQGGGESDELTKVTEHKNNLEKALASERAKNRSLQFMLDQSKENPPKTGDVKELDSDFKVLSKKEFEELKEDDPTAAIDYIFQFNEYKEAKAEKDRVANEARQVQEQTNTAISEALEQISLSIPGIYEDEAVGQKLTDFAVEKGFANEDLAILSNPATMVIPQGSNTPVPLGATATAFVKFCNSQMTGIDTSALEAEITERVTNDLLKKFKADPGAANSGLDDIPASGSGAPEKWEPKSEDELRGMSDADREKYYRGEPV